MVGDRVRIRGKKLCGFVTQVEGHEVLVHLDHPMRCRVSDQVSRDLWYRNTAVEVLNALERLAMEVPRAKG